MKWAILVGVGVAILVVYLLRRRKTKPPEPPVPPVVAPWRSVRVLNAPSVMHPGEQLQLEWEATWQPSGEEITDTLLWRVERDPRVPPGPDLPDLHISDFGLLTASAPTERLVYAVFAGSEVKAVAFQLSVRERSE